MADRLEDRFWKYVGPPNADGCREWTGGRNNYGYGTFWLDGRSVKAHRVAHELAVGPIPPGVKVCHSCDNPSCCEPSHLFLGTQSDNVRDSAQKRRHVQSRKTHCPHGHEYTPENTYLSPDGRHRLCRDCLRRNWTVQNAKRKKGGQHVG